MLISFSAAKKRYFTSQKEAANRHRKNKTENHKKDRQPMKERGKNFTEYVIVYEISMF